MTRENKLALRLAEIRIIGWMCGVKLRDKLLCVELRQWLGMEDIVEVVQRKDGWHGHVLRKDEDVWVKECYFGG